MEETGTAAKRCSGWGWRQRSCSRPNWGTEHKELSFRERTWYVFFKYISNVIIIMTPFMLTWAERSSKLFWWPVVRRLSVRPSVCPSVKLSYFRLHLKNHWANFNQTWHKSSLSERSTVKADNRKLISFMSFENITFIYRAFRVWAWPLPDKRRTSKKYELGLTDSIYKLVTWCDGHVVLVNNPIVFRSHLIFDSARA